MFDSNRRKSGRLVCAGLVSSLGVVADVSRGGCKVRCRHWGGLPLGMGIQVSLEGDGVLLLVNARIVRRTRLGLRQFEYGLEFVDLNDEQKRLLGEISRITSVQRVIPTVEEAANRAA